MNLTKATIVVLWLCMFVASWVVEEPVREAVYHLGLLLFAALSALVVDLNDYLTRISRSVERLETWERTRTEVSDGPYPHA